MHHIHGIHAQPPQVPPQAAPLPPGGKKPFSFLPELDAVADLGREEGALDPDGQGNAPGAPLPEEAREQSSAPVPEEPPAPPPPAVDLGIYTRTGAPRTPPPSAGGNCNASI